MIPISVGEFPWLLKYLISFMGDCYCVVHTLEAAQLWKLGKKTYTIAMAMYDILNRLAM